MTIPMLVLIISGLVWLLLSVRPPQRPSDFITWLRDACRIVFAASVLVALWGLMTKVAF